MREKVVKGVIKTAHNRDLSEYLKEDGTPRVPGGKLPIRTVAQQFENIDEVRAKNEFPNDSKIVKFVNAALVAKARTAAINVELAAAGIEKPTAENDPVVYLHEMYDLFRVKRPDGKQNSKEEARAKATAETGVEWDDEDDYDEAE